MITLYGAPKSGNTHKVRMALAFLQLDYEEISADIAMRKSAQFLALNPLAQVPVIVADRFVLRDSQAILAWLAAQHRAGIWDGQTPQERGEIGQWLSMAANENANGPAALRAIKLFGLPGDAVRATTVIDRILPVYDERLRLHTWLVADRMTIADIAVSPYLALLGDAGIALSDWPGIARWVTQIGLLPGFPEMPGWQRLGGD